MSTDDDDNNSGQCTTHNAPPEPVYTYFSLSFLQMCAMSGTNGSSGFGSQSNEHMDNKTGMKNEKDVIS